MLAATRYLLLAVTPRNTRCTPPSTDMVGTMLNFVAAMWHTNALLGLRAYLAE
jgi:hypothetical protein